MKISKRAWLIKKWSRDALVIEPHFVLHCISWWRSVRKNHAKRAMACYFSLSLRWPGRPKTRAAGKEGARARGGCKPGGPIEHGSGRLATPVVAGAPLARAGVYPPNGPGPGSHGANQICRPNLTRGSGPGLVFALCRSCHLALPSCTAILGSKLCCISQ